MKESLKIAFENLSEFHQKIWKEFVEEQIKTYQPEAPKIFKPKKLKEPIIWSAKGDIPIQSGFEAEEVKPEEVKFGIDWAVKTKDEKIFYEAKTASKDLNFITNTFYENLTFKAPKNNVIIKDIKDPGPTFKDLKYNPVPELKASNLKHQFPPKGIKPPKFIPPKSNHEPYHIPMHTRGEIKDYICKELVREGFKYHDVDCLIKGWANSANNSLQDAARRCFKIEPFIDNRWYSELQVSFIRKVYNLTQKDLKARGIRHLILYRGQYCEIKRLRPLSSFSTKLGIAEGFGNWIYKISVPIRYVVSSYYTGFGCSEEQEYVIMGGSNVERHLKIVRSPFTL